jgi:integrase
MNSDKLIQDQSISDFLIYVEKLSKDSIENLSKLINQKRRELYFDIRVYKIGEQSKKIEHSDFLKIINYEKNPKAVLSFKIMYYMGLRVSEVVLIRKEDIIGNKLNIHNVKCNRIETRAIPNILFNDLKEYIKTYDIEKGFLFNGLKKSHISKDWLRNRFRKDTLKLGINKIYDYSTHKGNKRRLFLYSTHSLRHSFANRFYEISNNDIEKTRIALRHKKLNTTQTYIKGNINEVNNIMLRM